MKAISFASSIVLAGALFVSAGAQAQESPYQLWQEDKTSPPVEDLYSHAATFTNEVADPVRLDDLAHREEADHSGARSPGKLLTGQNNALFSLLGATYGGDGRTIFSLPDLRG
ncbi:MAG: phage tail protein, partial [Gammaproteobacteria bacterium]|nr:phage tail protein [Gammaproteobacteria bacterium]